MHIHRPVRIALGPVVHIGSNHYTEPQQWIRIGNRG